MNDRNIKSSTPTPSNGDTAPSDGGVSSSLHARKCAICGKPVQPDDEHFPFCGKRCKTIDLGKWANEEYRVSRPIEQADLDEE